MSTLENTIIDDDVLRAIRGEIGDDLTQDFGLISAVTEVLPSVAKTLDDPVRGGQVTGITPETPTVARPIVRAIDLVGGPATAPAPVVEVPSMTVVDRVTPLAGQAGWVPRARAQVREAARETTITDPAGHADSVWDELRSHPERLGLITLAAVLVCVLIVVARWVPGVVHEPGSVVTRTVPPAGGEPHAPMVPLQHGLTPVHVRKAPQVKRHGTNNQTGATHTPTPSTSGVATSTPSTPGSASPTDSPSHATTPPVTGTPPAHGGGDPSGKPSATSSPSHRTTSPSVTPASPDHPSGTPRG